ncbi:MAG: SBBP repeat-containing protein [Blastocatellia bacterium]
MMKQSPSQIRAGVSAILIGLATWLGVFGLLAWSGRTSHSNVPASTQSSQSSPKASLSQLPLRFEANRGQTHESVRFVSRGQGYTIYLATSQARFELRSNGTNERSALGLSLIGASNESITEGIEPLPARSNYFIGSEPDGWQTDIPTYARVRQRGVYTGIDAVFYGNQHQLEYDFVVAPHANPQQIKMAFDGAGKIHIAEDGDLLLAISSRQLRMHKPVVYQETVGERREISAEFAIDDDNTVGFRLGEYDVNQPLVIDPVVDYSTYFGGSGSDIGYGIAVDSQGAVYLTGQTASLNFPLKNAAYTMLMGANDAFVMKLSPNGSTVVFSTYIGGRNPGDKGASIAVDKAGNIYFAGETNSLNFPLVNALQANFRGNVDGFVAKFNIEGNTLLYSTYLGGSFFDAIYSIAVDRFDNAYVTGRTESANFPTKNPLQAALRGQRDAFITKFTPDGALVYSTYLGGDLPPGASRDDESGYGIAVDPLQNAYVTGFTSTPSFPVVGAVQSNFAGVEDAFVTKINATGSALIYSTFLGGNRTDEARAVAVDALGNAYITGYTFSIDFPTSNALQRQYGGNVDAFVTKINATGAALIYSTFLGGNGAENTGLVSDNIPVGSIAVDNLGNAYVTGKTESENFPVVRPVQSSLRGDNDIFIAKIDPAGMALIYSTYLGSTFTGENGFDERGLDIAVDNFGSVYITGQVLKNDFLTVLPEQANFGGGLSDAFVCKISTPDILTLAPVSTASFTGPSLAPEEIVAVFGANLASGTDIAQTVPLPTSLLGSSVKVKDKTNAERTSSLFFVSPGQINFQIPPGTAEGKATITVTSTTADGQNVQTSTTVLIEKTAPGLFTANANGKDVAAAIVVRVKSDGSQTFEPVAQLNAQNMLIPVLIDFGPASDQLFLILFGTGWRNRSAVEKVTAQVGGVNAPVLFAGAQGSFLGEDQINLQLPRSLAGSGETIVAVTVDGQSANLVTVAFR